MRADTTNTSEAAMAWTGAAARHDGVQPPRPWPLAIIALAAGVALWSGWVELGRMTGFGVVTPLPGIADGFQINSAIVLPMSVEAYAAYAVRVALALAWLSERTRQFAKRSVVVSLLIGGFAQVASHLMTEAGITSAPWGVTVLVASVPVLVTGLATGLAQLVHQDTIRGRALAGPGHQPASAAVVPAPYRRSVVQLVVIPAPVVRQAVAEPRPVLADRPALDTDTAQPVVQPASPDLLDTAIDLPLATLQRAHDLIRATEREGRRIGRPTLARALDISERQARRVLEVYASSSLDQTDDQETTARV